MATLFVKPEYLKILKKTNNIFLLLQQKGGYLNILFVTE